MTKHLPREYLMATERVLREFPAKIEELHNLGRYIEDRFHSVNPEVEPSGLSVRSVSSPQEKILEAKENDRHYLWLYQYVETVRQALSVLNEDEQALVDCLYWQNMTILEASYELSVDKRTIFRTKKRAAVKIACRLLPSFVEDAKNCHLR